MNLLGLVRRVFPRSAKRLSSDRSNIWFENSIQSPVWRVDRRFASEEENIVEKPAKGAA